MGMSSQRCQRRQRHVRRRQLLSSYRLPRTPALSAAGVKPPKGTTNEADD
jgi:hypothetical protein